MSRSVLLDAGPLGLVTGPRRTPVVQAAQHWLDDLPYLKPPSRCACRRGAASGRTHARSCDDVSAADNGAKKTSNGTRNQAVSAAQGTVLDRRVVAGGIIHTEREEATMTLDEYAHQLHDRATRGEVLSNEEQLHLEHWYAEQDRAEQAVLDANQGTTRATLQHLGERITFDPRMMAGKPIIRGTRIPVELVVRMVAQGTPDADILREYPRLQPEDIRAALLYAAQVVADEDVFPLSPSV